MNKTAIILTILVHSLAAFGQSVSSVTAQEGDTLIAISNRTGVPLAELRSLNPGMPEMLKAGVKIFLPSTTDSGEEGRTIRAQAGDTVTKVAERYRLDPLELAKYNGLLPNSVLGAGRELRLPAGRRVFAQISGMFGPNSERLPVGFKGSDLMQVQAALSRYGKELKAGCGEFEKTTDCYRRLREISDRDIGMGLKAGSPLAFVLPNLCRYDADRSVFRCWSNSEEWFNPGYLWMKRDLPSSSYIGENAFGVRRRITVKNIESRRLRLIGTPRNFDTKIVDTAQARKIADRLRTCVIGTFVSPYAQDDILQIQPTVSSPFKYSDRYTRFYFEINQVWVFDPATGEILAKYEV